MAELIKNTILRLNTYGDLNHGGSFCIACPALKFIEATALPSPPPMPGRRSGGLRPPEAEAFFTNHPCPLTLGDPGVPKENYDFLESRMCILERTQRRIGIVDEKKLLRLNTYVDRNHRGGGHFALHAPPSKLERQCPSRLRRPCQVGAWGPETEVLFSQITNAPSTCDSGGHYPRKNLNFLDAGMCMLACWSRSSALSAELA